MHGLAPGRAGGRAPLAGSCPRLAGTAEAAAGPEGLAQLLRSAFKPDLGPAASGQGPPPAHETEMVKFGRTLKGKAQARARTLVCVARGIATAPRMPQTPHAVSPLPWSCARATARCARAAHSQQSPLSSDSYVNYKLLKRAIKSGVSEDEFQRLHDIELRKVQARACACACSTAAVQLVPSSQTSLPPSDTGVSPRGALTLGLQPTNVPCRSRHTGTEVRV